MRSYSKAANFKYHRHFMIMCKIGKKEYIFVEKQKKYYNIILFSFYFIQRKQKKSNFFNFIKISDNILSLLFLSAIEQP